MVALNDYFQGAIKQHLERGRLLLAKIPANLPREFYLLAQTCRKELDTSLDVLRSLLEEPKMELPENQTKRLRVFQQLVAHMNVLETVGIAALERHNETDLVLNQLIERIRTEISYPLLPPVVSSLSQQYFHIYPKLNLLCVPLGEADFLLHLPDLYHEMAHPLITEKYDPRVEPFQKTFSNSLDLVSNYVIKEQQKEERRRGPGQIGYYLQIWEKSWWKWVIEFLCDLFAVYTIGPAYAWAHFHLCAKVCDDPYQVPTIIPSSHPADYARMQVMLYGLQKTGFGEERDVIREHWQEFVAISGSKREPEYQRCYPEDILESLAQYAHDGVVGMGCRIAVLETDDPVHKILNQAWKEFWKEPKKYPEWEREAVDKLRKLCAVNG